MAGTGGWGALESMCFVFLLVQDLQQCAFLLTSLHTLGSLCVFVYESVNVRDR